MVHQKLRPLHANKCTDKETCNHNCCKGKTKQTVDLMVLMRNGNIETHKLSCQDDATQQAHGEHSEDSFWDEPDHHQFHQTVANICVIQPNQNGDFAYSFSDEELTSNMMMILHLNVRIYDFWNSTTKFGIEVL